MYIHCRQGRIYSCATPGAIKMVRPLPGTHLHNDSSSWSSLSYNNHKYKLIFCDFRESNFSLKSMDSVLWMAWGHRPDRFHSNPTLIAGVRVNPLLKKESLYSKICKMCISLIPFNTFSSPNTTHHLNLYVDRWSVTRLSALEWEWKTKILSLMKLSTPIYKIRKIFLIV